MTATVIDTLRYADRLKQAGVAPGQAEGMSRALNDELTEGLVTRKDLDDAVAGLKGDLDDAVAGLKGDLDDAVAGLKGDLGDAVAGLKGDLNDAVVDLKGDIDGLGNRIDVLETKFDSKFDGVDARFEAMDVKFEAMDVKFEAMDVKFDALSSQSKYVFLVLALIAGLGLYNATAPHFLGKSVPADGSSLVAPTALTKGNPANAASTPG
ncbi:MAG: hypothetical protein F4Y41_21505, partial [Gammaproteobacteria bacterium]|nr:hypothetical protein [Gammaproteobacteria bacterium]